MSRDHNIVRLTDEELTSAIGGYVIVNHVGCYELYNEKDEYVATFRGDQLEQLRNYARALGISDEFKDLDHKPRSSRKSSLL